MSIAVLILIGAIVVMAGLYFTPELSQNKIVQAPNFEIDKGTATPNVVRVPSVHIYGKDSKTVVITWEYLPASTKKIDIYRTPKTDKEDWKKWKTVTIGEGAASGGSFEIKTQGENMNNYEFYFQAVGGGGSASGTASGTGSGAEEVTWTSSSTVVTPPPPPAPTSTTGGGSSNPPSSTPPAPPTPSSTPSTTPTSTNPPPDSPPAQPLNQIYYYTPTGQLSGTSSLTNTDNFWVVHTNNKIEIGWQNFPSSTDAIVIYRSQNQNGPWLQLLRQEGSGFAGPYVIGLLDNTLSQAYYYKIQALDDSNPVAGYGPVLLNPL